MRFPQPLMPHGTIGFVAPSFGCNIEPYKSAFQNALTKFKGMGYSLDLGPNCFEGSGIGISNAPSKCADELTNYYCSDKNNVLLSCGGGELMCEILNDLDFEAIKRSPAKWFMGYSDNTNMTFLLTTICDTASIYGPCAPAFGMEPWHPAIEDAFLVLTGQKQTVTNYDSWEKESLKNEERPLLPYHVTEPVKIRIFQGNKQDSAHFGGRLIGGCMDCLVNLLGTKFDHVDEFNQKYKDDGLIWFLESCDLNIMAIRRAMWQMDNAGWFQNVRGFLIGRPYVYGQELFGLDQYQAVYDVISKYQAPVIMDVDIGHLAPMMPIVCGSKATIEASGNSLKITMNYC